MCCDVLHILSRHPLMQALCTAQVLHTLAAAGYPPSREMGLMGQGEGLLAAGLQGEALHPGAAWLQGLLPLDLAWAHFAAWKVGLKSHAATRGQQAWTSIS